jgi:hypothetical protein
MMIVFPFSKKEIRNSFLLCVVLMGFEVCCT